MNKKRILIVGASGFVGSALKRRLKKDQTLEVFTPSSKEMDALDGQRVSSFLRENKIQYVYHAAANHAGIGTGICRHLYFLESNLIMNYNLVKASYENGIIKFITFGTSCCYNDETKYVMDEGDYWKNRSENTYGTCKRVLLEHLENQQHMDWVYLIPPNLYGPGDHFGKKDAHFIPATIKKFDDAVSDGTNEIMVWGDGSQKRDFVYIDDLVDILEKCLHTNVLDKKAVNISTAFGTSIKEVVLLIQKYMGCGQVKVCWDITKPTGVKQKVLDHRLFCRIMPDFVFTRIEEGIANTVNWHINKEQW